MIRTFNQQQVYRRRVLPARALRAVPTAVPAPVAPRLRAHTLTQQEVYAHWLRCWVAAAGHGNGGTPTSSVPLTSVSIAGDTTGSVNTEYQFTASYLPNDASTPVSYNWSPAPKAGQGTATATYEWATSGQKTVTVTATNAAGSVQDSHTITLSATFAPSDLAGLTLWLEHDSGVYQDTVGGTLAATNDPVGAWEDQSGQGNHATQTGTARPTRGADGIIFNGSSTYLENAALSNGTQISVFVRFVYTSGGSYRRLFVNEINVFVGAINGNAAAFYGNGSSWQHTSDGRSGTLTPGTAYTLSAINDGNDTTWLNGVLLGARVAAMGAFSDGYLVGGGNNQVWDGSIKAMLVYNRVLNATERAQVETYLSNV